MTIGIRIGTTVCNAYLQLTGASSIMKHCMIVIVYIALHWCQHTTKARRDTRTGIHSWDPALHVQCCMLGM
jgi:hypothetical protein